MNFIQKIKNSIYSPEFYSNIPKESLGSSIKYFLLLILLATVITAIVPIWLFATIGQKEINTIPGKVVNAFPKGLEVKIKGGKVSTNAREPYFITIPNSENSSNQVKNLIVIDTKTPFSATKFDQYSSFVWVTKDSVFTKDRSQFKAFDLSGVSDTTINRGFVASAFAKITPWLKYVTFVISVFILLGLYIFNFLRLIFFFFLAFLAWLLLKLIKKPLSYADSYKVVLYAGTLSLIVEVLAGVAHWYGFPFMFTLITLLVVLFNFLPANLQRK